MNPPRHFFFSRLRARIYISRMEKGKNGSGDNDYIVIFIFFVSFFFLFFFCFLVSNACAFCVYFFFPLQLVVATIQNLQVKRKTEIKHLRIVNRLIASFVRSFVTRIVLSSLSLSLSLARVLKCKKKKRKKKRGGGREKTLGNLQNRFTPFVKPDKNWLELVSLLLLPPDIETQVMFVYYFVRSADNNLVQGPFRFIRGSAHFGKAGTISRKSGFTATDLRQSCFACSSVKFVSFSFFFFFSFFSFSFLGNCLTRGVEFPARHRLGGGSSIIYTRCLFLRLSLSLSLSLSLDFDHALFRRGPFFFFFFLFSISNSKVKK